MGKILIDKILFLSWFIQHLTHYCDVKIGTNGTWWGVEGGDKGLWDKRAWLNRHFASINRTMPHATYTVCLRRERIATIGNIASPNWQRHQILRSYSTGSVLRFPLICVILMWVISIRLFTIENLKSTSNYRFSFLKKKTRDFLIFCRTFSSHTC